MPDDQTPDEQIQAARENEAGLLGALVSGQWPSGDPVGVAEAVTIQIFEGEGTEGKTPIRTVRARIVNGEVVVGDEET